MYKFINEETLVKYQELLKLPEDCPESAGETVAASLPDLVRAADLGCLRLQQVSDTVVQTLPDLNINSQGLLYSEGQSENPPVHL